jgi:radical SAM superfamily enzyme
MFIDDNFIGNISWTREFMHRIQPLKLIWHAAVSVNIVFYPDLLDEIKNSGCQSLFIGFETINQQSLQSVGKAQNRVEKYEKLIRELHLREIMVNASLVLGFDHDKPTVFKETLDWLVKTSVIG